MSFMFATLEVSKLSGWLNACAFCREAKGGYTVLAEVCGSAGGGRGATAVQAACRAGFGCRLRAGHGEERAANIPYMRTAESRKEGIRCGARYTGRHAGSNTGDREQPRCEQRAGQGSTADSGQGTGTVLVVVRVRRKQCARGGSDRRLSAGQPWGAHPEHLIHARDARGVPV
eukprot:scaffold107693_cov56-Phaeocystis_antarctica.AAC.3